MNAIANKPECRIESLRAGGYYGQWRISGVWRRVKSKDGGPFQTPYDALKAAQDRLHARLFPEIRVDRPDVIEDNVDEVAIKEEVSRFFANREKQRVDLTQSTLGQIFARKKGGSTRAVTVERKRKRGPA